ncbi:MAG TPA: enoyl-CoA hydratase-related protein [Candidatus Binataceae bacterium]|nr:enoyl-CoA hydratase-related protein [Candidatus Binataceae bacterium]
MSFSDILYDKSDRIATITLNRPEKLNAWTRRMGDEVREVMLEADRDDEVRVIVVTGAGRAYCAGADMELLSKISRGEESATRAEAPRGSSEVEGNYIGRFSYMLGMRKPIIGAINGVCVGIGFTSSLYFDMRIASDTARIGLIFVRRGLAIEHGSSWMLPRLVGVPAALDLALTGRLVDAQEALAMGLVSRVVPADKLIATVREVAGEIATKCAPLGVAQAKRMIYDHLFTDLVTAIREDDQATESVTASEDFKEGVTAFREKRPARFRGR